MMSVAQAFAVNGWVVLPQDPRVQDWVAAAQPAARRVLDDPAMRARCMRHGQTWFAGVDAFPNASDGSIGGVALAGPWERLVETPAHWHRGQLSVVYPGYPGRDDGESDAAHRFRRDRDAAHLDGLLAEGPLKSRYLKEPHAFILGLPLTPMTTADGAFTVWDGSHRVIGDAFRATLSRVPPEDQPMQDVTAVYTAARKRVFDSLPRRVVVAAPGEAILVHRMAIHGTAPWREPQRGTERMIVWFRPLLPSVKAWLAGDGRN
jgi:hypothetical protein